MTDWIGRAANEGVELLAFGETFLGGYPLWIGLTDGARFNDADQKRAFAAYLDAAVELDGPEVATVVEAVRDRGVDPTGHYSRPDVLHLEVNRRRLAAVEFDE